MTDDLALVGLGEDEDEDTYQMMMQSSSTASLIEEEELDTTPDDDNDDESERGEPPIHPFAALEKSATALPEPKPAKKSTKSKKKKDKKDQPKALAEYGTFHVLKRTGNKRTWGWIESFEETVPPSRSLLRDRFGPGSYRIEDTMGGSDEFVISPTPAASHTAGSKPARRDQDGGDRHRLVMTTLLSLEERIDQVGDKVSDIDPGSIADEVVRRLSRMLLPTLRPLIEGFEKERAEFGATISRIEGDVAALKTESERQNDDQLTAILKTLDDLQTRVSNPPPAAASAPADPYDRILDDLTKASAFVQRLTGAGVAGAHDVSRSAPPPQPQAGELEQPAWVHVVVNALQAFSGMLRASTPPFQGAPPVQAVAPPPSAGMYEQGVAVPPNAVPPNAVPPNAVPPNAVPPNAVPPNAVPPNGQAAAGPVPPNGQAVPPNGQRGAPSQAASATAGPPPPTAPAIAKMTPEIEAEAKKLGAALGLGWPELVSIAQQHDWDAETLLHATRLWTENAVTLDGMTAEIEAELRQIAQRMNIPYEYGIGLAKEHDLDAPALLELARRQLSAAAGASGGRGDAS